MKAVLLLFILLYFFGLVLAATTPVLKITGGKVVVRGGQLAVGPIEKGIAASTSTTGQCMGIICGVTYPF